MYNIRQKIRILFPLLFNNGILYYIYNSINEFVQTIFTEFLKLTSKNYK